MLRVLTVAELADHPALAMGNVLDLRPEAEFATRHLRGAVSLSLEPDLADLNPEELESRLAADLPSILLPPKHEPMLVVATTSRVALLVAAALQGRGRKATDAAVLTPDTAPLCVEGRSQRVLWSPPSFLRRWVHLLPPPAAGPVLDLASGSGRAAVWLADRGWRVTAIDHQPEALRMAGRLAASRGVTVTTRCADLRRPTAVPEGPWAAVLLFRYLDRGLLSRVPGLLKPGGVVMFRTFRDAPGYLGNPRPRHRVGTGEATSWWNDAGVEMLVHEEGFDEDGKPATGLVARRL